MKKTTLDNLLSLINIPYDKWFLPKEIKSILLDTDATQFVNPKIHKIKFSSTDELIRIKYIRLKNISAPLYGFGYNAEKNCLIFKDISLYTKYKAFIRDPKENDKIFAYDSKDDSYTGSVISKIERINNEIYIYFLDNLLITKIENTNYNMKYFILLGEYDINTAQNIRKTEFVEIIDISNYPADIYIPIDHVTGFDFSQQII